MDFIIIVHFMGYRVRFNVEIFNFVFIEFKTIVHYDIIFQQSSFTSVATLALGSRPKQRELQGCRPRRSPGVKAKGSPGVTSHTPGSVRKCEGV